MPKRHVVKCLPKYYESMIIGEKTAELRLNDRDYQVHDALELNEYDPETETFTGRSQLFLITHIVQDERWLQPQCCMLSVQKLSQLEAYVLGLT